MQITINSTTEFNERKLIPRSIWEQWKEALLSGQYKQGTGFLNYNNEYFCCLGVACEVFGDKLLKKKKNSGRYQYNSTGIILPNSHVLTPYIQHNGRLSGFSIDGHQSLATLNDKGYTFEQIAWVIEMYMVDNGYRVQIDSIKGFNKNKLIPVEEARKWLAALRSGDYDQCQEQLAFDGGFCCLGVACEVGGIPYHSLDGNLPSASHLYKYLGREGKLCHMTIRHEKSVSVSTLISCNDTLELNFKQIADIIEGYLCKRPIYEQKNAK